MKMIHKIQLPYETHASIHRVEVPAEAEPLSVGVQIDEVGKGRPYLWYMFNPESSGMKSWRIHAVFTGHSYTLPDKAKHIGMTQCKMPGLGFDVVSHYFLESPDA